MIFKEHQLTPEEYKNAFLHFIEVLAPEVMDAIKSLISPFKQLTDGMSDEQVELIFEGLFETEPECISEILFCFDDNFRGCTGVNPELNEKQKTILNNFLAFQQNFLEIIKRFGLDKRWLKLHIFETLVLQASSPHLRIIFTNKDHFWFMGKGEPLTFNFDGWYFCDDESGEYEKRAIESFKEHLSGYIKETVAQAKNHGYKLNKGGRNYNSVKWLVLWTVKGISKDDILLKMDEERSAKLKKEKTTDISTLNKAFQKFREFDLPVREEK